MKSPYSLLLAGTACVAILAAQPQALADPVRTMRLAQDNAIGAKQDDSKPQQQQQKKQQQKQQKQQAQPQQQEQKQQQQKQQAQPQQQQQKQQEQKQQEKKQQQKQQAQPQQQQQQQSQPQQQQEQRQRTRQGVPQQGAPQQGAPQQGAPQQDRSRRAQPQQQPADNAVQTAAPPQPTKTQSKSDFIRRKGEKASGGIEDVRKRRKSVQDGDRVVIQEGDRTIVRTGKRTIIRHNESQRFAVGARRVETQRRGNEIITIALRPNGMRIVTVTDRNGHLIRRIRRGADGRDFVIIDNSGFGPQRRDMFVDLRRPRVRDRDRYIVEAGRADRNRIYEVFTLGPIDDLDRRYSLEEVRYSEPLRAYMPRVDLDINFESGSWQITPDQFDQLAAIADGMKRTIEQNPREVFLIEGHTDGVGTDDDNLSLSDRRAESVAVALTEEFAVPAENIVTQGYGEEHPKVETDGPSRENRRVAVRRITPLMAEIDN
jgi:outer membrane protein OmpA-like peptidoglycan-associated protein